MKPSSPTRQRLLDCALRLFVEKGVTETSVRDLAEAAGIAEGTLYRHYASKADLTADLFVSNYTAFAHRLTRLQSSGQSFQAKLRALTAEVYGFHDENPTLFRFLLLIQHQGLPRIEDGPDNPVSVLQSMVEDALTRHEIDPIDPALATAMILGLLLQPATALLYGRLGGSTLSGHADLVAMACWRALTPVRR